MKKIPFQLAGKIIIGILSIITVFHFLVLFGAVPYDIVWGGRMENKDQMIQFEIISISINVIAILTTTMKMMFLKAIISFRVINVILWLFVFLFFLNTVGNLFALNSIETIIFTPITLVLAVLMLRLVLEKNPEV